MVGRWCKSAGYVHNTSEARWSSRARSMAQPQNMPCLYGEPTSRHILLAQVSGIS